MSTEHDRDERLDDALRAYLAAELDPQLGRARRAFERHLAGARPAAPRRARSRSRARGWVIGVVGTALAACVAAVWAVPALWPRDSHTLTGATEPPAPPTRPPMPVAAVTHTRPAPVGWQHGGVSVTSVTHNVGCVVVGDGGPARLVERVDVERREWFDPGRGVRVEAVYPQREVQLIGLDTY
jgi:hypothetical protein